MSDGFLGRWSRRKQEARAGLPEPEPLQEPEGSSRPIEPDTATATPTPSLPTLADARALTPQSDFAPFVARAVSPEVRNAAMKQLFRDPHFNVMDGLDTYIDDYSVADPLPLETLRKMVSAEFVGLLPPDDSIESDAPPSDPLPASAQADADRLAMPGKDPDAPTVAQWEPNVGAAPAALVPPPADASQTHHAHAHLRLQPNDATPEERSGDSNR